MPKPIHTIKRFGCCVAIWGNDKKDPSITIQKNYKGKDGKYHQGTTFWAADLGNLLLALMDAAAWMSQYRTLEKSDGIDPNEPIALDEDKVPF